MAEIEKVVHNAYSGLAFGGCVPERCRVRLFVVFSMAKKQKSNPEGQLLALLKDVLPKAVSDEKLVEKIYAACEREISAKVRVHSFQEFCTRAEVPDLEDNTIEEIQKQFENSFGKGTVTIVPHLKKQAATVEVVVDGEVLEGVVRVGKNGSGEGDDGDPEFKPKFVPFPVSLATDPELVWTFGRGENLTPEEAAISLGKAQEDFWASKQGQTLLHKKRVEKNFAEFVSRVPSKFLSELGLKRHYKEPEPVKQLRPVKR